MAKLAPPKQVKRDEPKNDLVEKVQSIRPSSPVDQPAPGNIKPLQLKVEDSVKAEYKAYCAMKDITMSAMFVEMFEQYKENH
jgi:hypothetical protein